MNRKGRIIVSVTGIFIVLLILLALTYGYYLTRIKGNINKKSIVISNSNLEIEYADVNEELITDTDSYPGKSWTKTFSVTSKGKYKEAVTYGVALENVINPYERNDDLVYTLKCEQYLRTGFSIDKENKSVSGTLSGTCNGVSSETTFPVFSKILIENDIDEDKAQVYTLIVNYKEMDEDQSVDMNKTFSAKVNIVEPKTFFNTTNLSAVIYNNALNGTGDKTVYKDVPDTVPAEDECAIDERELSKAVDDYGTSYYFRGSIIDNYIDFAGMCWRIVRIAGDGSIKLILEDQDSTCASSDGNWDIPTGDGSG